LKGNRVVYDIETKGFGLRTTAAGAKSFVLNYRAAGGRERRLTIGSFPDWTVKQARAEAKKLKRAIDGGSDPMADRQANLAAPTVNTLADRFERDELPKRRAATRRDYAGILRLYIRPHLGALKVADVRHADVEHLHRRIAATAPYRANRTVAVLSKLFSPAMKWEMRGDNPGDAGRSTKTVRSPTRFICGAMGTPFSS
jgi:Arm DNA-binding domain